MKIKFLLFLILFSAISCRTMKYDYFKISQLEQNKGFQVYNNSEKINSKYFIFDKRNIVQTSISRSKKRIDIVSRNKQEFSTLDEIYNSINDKFVRTFVVFGIPLLKEDFEKTKIEISGIDSINVIKVPTSCNNSSVIVIKMKK